MNHNNIQYGVLATLLRRTLEHDEVAIGALPGLALAHDDGRGDWSESGGAWGGSMSTESWSVQLRLARSTDYIFDKNNNSIPFLRSSGLPFFTEAMIMSPTAAPGRRFRRPP